MEYVKEFLNYEQMESFLKNLYTKAVEEMDCDASRFEDEIDCCVEIAAESFLIDMDTYVHKSDTSMWGNFANIREDWNDIPDFVTSDVKPWGRFDDVIESIDKGTISEGDLKKFQTWCFDWFLTAFGTYNLKYNFQSHISDLIYEEENFS